jgi:protein-S-isoprenylcysteine O-methyltransferase Ste14
MKPKVWLALAIEAIVLAVLLFGSAGTLRWPAGWAFMAVFFSTGIVFSILLARHDPALLDERLKWVIQKGQPLWDRVFVAVFLPIMVGWIILMGLDAGRYHWSVMPAWLQVVGGLGLVLSVSVMYRIFRENTFAAGVVRIQKERGQRVISTGPYAIVRHPLYASMLIYLPALALMLGSWYGLAASFLLFAVMIIRTALEDRELQRGLEGYAEYAQRVRYRLIPGIW